MSGGQYTSKNKKLPGAYVNVFSTAKRDFNAESERGVVFSVVSGLNWGGSGVIEVTPTSDFMALFGQDITSPALVGIKQILTNASKVYVFNMNSGIAASGTSAVLPWKFTAKYPGTVGNSLRVIVMPDPSKIGRFHVKTYVDADMVDSQIVASASALVANDYIEPAVTEADVADDGVGKLGDLVSPVQVSLTGGTTDEVAMKTDELVAAIETYEFNTLAAPAFSATNSVHMLFATTAIRMRDEQGRKVQAVIPATDKYEADHEGVIAVENGVKLADGTVYGPEIMIGWVAGAEAAAAENVSLTYKKIAGAVDVMPRFTEGKQAKLVDAGRMVFIASRDAVKVLTDVNSLHTFTDTKNESFSKNRVLRVLDSIANNTREVWEENFIGQVTNNEAGRDLFKANRAEYLAELQTQGAIENFTPEDITVTVGNTKDSVVATINVQPTDAMEKLYMTVYVN